MKASRASTGPSSSTPASPSSARPGADAEETTGAEKPPEPEPLPPPASSKDQNLGVFEDELRGFRLLKAAGLTNDQRMQVLTLTRNVAFEKIREALRALFYESDLSARQPRRKQVWYEEEAAGKADFCRSNAAGQASGSGGGGCDGLKFPGHSFWEWRDLFRRACFGPFVGFEPLQACGPLLGLLGPRGLFWPFYGFLFWSFPGFSQPFLGLAASSKPFLGPGPLIFIF